MQKCFLGSERIAFSLFVFFKVQISVFQFFINMFSIPAPLDIENKERLHNTLKIYMICCASRFHVSLTLAVSLLQPRGEYQTALTLV